MKPQFEVLWTLNYSLDELPHLANRIHKDLIQQEEYCVWLEGPLGAGKTTLTREILRSHGLSEKEQVPSPTFTYLIEYKIRDNWYAHMDLYRITSKTKEPLHLLESRQYKGCFIEWPQNSPDYEEIFPTHKVELKSLSDTTRQLTMYYCKNS